MFAALALLLPALVPQAAAPPAAVPAAVDPALPRVLLIGDSISIAYTDPVRKELAGVANVYRIPGNGGPTARGLTNVEAWLGDGKWDVIHVNWGLHDLAHVDANGARVHPDEGVRQAPPRQYGENLVALFDRLERTGAKLIWATTTPVPEGATARIADEALAYNKVAETALKGRDFAVNDLHAVASENLAEYQRPRNVHFTPKGIQALAKAVAASIRQALATEDPPTNDVREPGAAPSPVGDAGSVSPRP